MSTRQQERRRPGDTRELARRLFITSSIAVVVAAYVAAALA